MQVLCRRANGPPEQAGRDGRTVLLHSLRDLGALGGWEGGRPAKLGSSHGGASHGQVPPREWEAHLQAPAHGTIWAGAQGLQPPLPPCSVHTGSKPGHSPQRLAQKPRLLSAMDLLTIIGLSGRQSQREEKEFMIHSSVDQFHHNRLYSGFYEI